MAAFGVGNVVHVIIVVVFFSVYCVFCHYLSISSVHRSVGMMAQSRLNTNNIMNLSNYSVTLGTFAPNFHAM